MTPDKAAILSMLPLMRNVYPHENWPTDAVAEHLNEAFVGDIQADYISLAHIDRASDTPWKYGYLDYNALAAALLVWATNPPDAGSGCDWSDIDLADGHRAMA